MDLRAESHVRNGNRLGRIAAGPAATAFRDAIRPAWPPTEHILVFVGALEKARAELGPHLDAAANCALADALKTAKRWMSG